MSKGAYIGVTPPTYGELAVGSTVKLNVGGVATNFLVVHQGNPDSAQYDASCNGTWLLMENTYTSMAWNNGGNDYGNSDVHEYLNGEFLALFDSDIQALIKQVKIPYRNGIGTTSGGTNDYGENGLSTKAFLLSVRELGWTASDVSKATPEGAALSYFAPNQNALRVAYKSGSTSASLWATRTPVTGASTSVNRVYTNGSNDSIAVKNSSGIRPAIIMPSNSSSANGAIARKVKKGYIGIEGLARKIKKAYIGVNGVARPCWSGGELAYYGTITGLGVAEYGVVSANVGDYALFAGNDSSTVTVYNSSLIRSTTTLSGTGSSWTAAGVGNYALFGGYMKSNRPYGTVNAFDTSLTRTSPTSLGYARYSMGGTSVGNYALFAGGYNNSIAYVANVDAYNKSLTRSTPTSLDWACEQPQGAKVGNYGLFCGGYNGIASNNVAAYNASLTYSTPTVLSVGRYNNGSSTIGDYALIGGGAADSGNENAVDAYSASLTRSTPTSLSVARCGLSATTVGEYALFGGGIANSKSDVVDAYDANLIRSTLTPLSVARYDLGAATIGKYALFAGGTDSNGAFSSVVDAYTIA